MRLQGVHADDGDIGGGDDEDNDDTDDDSNDGDGKGAAQVYGQTGPCQNVRQMGLHVRQGVDDDDDDGNGTAQLAPRLYGTLSMYSSWYCMYLKEWCCC